MVSDLAWAVQYWSGFSWECIHARGIGRRQVPCCCQWPTPQEVFSEHVGKRVTRADQIHLAIPRKANTLSWPVKKKKEKGQHVELARKKKRKANTLSWPVKKRKKEKGQHVELDSKKKERP